MPWYQDAMACPDMVVISQPFISTDSESIVVTISKRFDFNNKTNSAVTAIDLDMSWSIYSKIVDAFPGFDHFFILDV